MATSTKRARSGFGTILRRELDAQGISTRELARRLTREEPDSIENMRRTLIRYMQGTSPGESRREAIARELGIDAAVFAEDKIRNERRDRVLDALAPLADVLLELAIEVAREKEIHE